MVGKRTVVGVSGSVSRPSRTTALVTEIVSRITAELDFDGQVIELLDEAPHLFTALHPTKLEGRAREVVDLVEAADLLVVGTPVYRASMTGAFKHLFDLVDHRAFVGKPVVLSATGGSLLHGLVTEHQLRPLFGFLNALTLPTTIYAVESDFEDYQVVTAKVRDRVDRIVEEVAIQLAGPAVIHGVDKHRFQASA